MPLPLTHKAADKLMRWSPLACLPKATLTKSGLLEMDRDDGEVEMMFVNDVELRSDNAEPMVPLSSSGSGAASTEGKEWIDRDSNLKMTLTTHRLVFFQERNVRFLHLSTLHQAQTAGSGSGMLTWSSPKISLNTYMGDLLLVFRSNGAAKDRDDLLKFLLKALERRAWEAQTRLQAKKKASQTIASRKVGIDAIMSKNTLRHKEAARLTDEAFEGDAEQLLRDAGELVKVIQKYASTLERKEDKTGKEEEDAARLSDMLQNMGMTSALSKQNFRGQHDDYTQTLARQLSDFLRPKLPAASGLLTLTDVYCLYNRARGSNLISPDDLLKAVDCMKSLNLGMSKRVFPSGVIVVQEDSFDDDVMATKLRELAEEQLSLNSGLTAMEVSRTLHISALLAYEQLLQSEKLGYLCRDETLETTRFYPNLFEEFAIQLKKQRRQ